MERAAADCARRGRHHRQRRSASAGCSAARSPGCSRRSCSRRRRGCMLLARRIIIDIHITMWIGLVLLCFALAETRPQRRRLYLCLMYVAAGFGVLTKGTGRRVSAGRRVLHLPRVAEAARRSAAHDAADRRAHQPGDRRAVVLPAVSRARMGIHRVVHLRREPRPLCGGGRRTVARRAVLHPGDARRSLPVVAS